MTQTSDGMLWVGTAGGLASFDGERFHFVSINSSNRISKQKINVLSAGKDGGLWVGTGGEGLLLLRGDKSNCYSLRELDPNVLALLRMPDDSMWIGTRKGMAVIRNDALAVRTDKYDAAPGPEKDAFTATVRAIVPDAKGNLWIGAGDHLMQLRDGAVIASLNLIEFNPTYIRAICCRRDGSIWVAANSGLLRFQNGKFQHLSKTDGLPDNVVTAILEDSRGNLWVGTSGGLCRFVDGKFVAELTTDGDVYDQILCLFEDRENNLWVGAKNGLYQLRVQQFTSYTARHGLAHNNVISVYEERDGTLWIGTWGGGIHCVRDGKVTVYSTATTKTMRNDLVVSIQGASDGGIWFSGDYDSGLYRLKDGNLKRYSWEQGFDPVAARALLEHPPGRLLIGTALRSIVALENEKFTDFTKPETLPSRNIRALLKAHDGRLWIGTEGGLVIKSNDVFATFTTTNGLVDNFVHCLFEDGERSIWAGTARGMTRFDQSGNLFSYTTAQGLPEEGVLDILQDESNHLWLASRQGVIRVERDQFTNIDNGKSRTLSTVTFGRADGMISSVCVGVCKPSAWKTRDGRLWFATTKGVAVTNPTLEIRKNEVPPPVVIGDVIADKKNVTGSTVRAAPARHASTLKPSNHVTVEPGQGDLEINYVALSYVAPEKNRFKYQLKGFDADWVDAGTRRTAFYNSVPPGSYEFQVIACNNDGVWNSVGSAIQITLQPHCWQTKWFRGMIAFSAFGFVAGTARFLTWKKVRTRMRLLEQQHAIEKERTRIAQDMHDELGARLTEIRVLSDLTESKKNEPAEVEAQSRRISAATGELIRNLHSIVWAVNPANDSLEKLADYICGFAQSFLHGAGIRCRLERPDSLPETKLSSEVRHNIVMAIKEALNNTIKHADALEVRMALCISASNLAITIADNGKGFENSTGSLSGNGLQNMERRMHSINGCCQLLTEPGKGTTIRFKIPLQNGSAH